jgi:ubiquitin-protein ligase
MSSNDNKLTAMIELKSLEKTDFCKILNDFRNLNDPVLLRIHIGDEESTSTPYECEDEQDKGKNPYRGGYYLLELLFGSQYKEVVPTIIFRTPIYHANISDKDGYICSNALNKWNVSEYSYLYCLRILLISE